MENKAFPSDDYAVQSQVILNGFDPKDSVVRLGDDKGILTEEDIEVKGKKRKKKKNCSLSRFATPIIYIHLLYVHQFVFAKSLFSFFVLIFTIREFHCLSLTSLQCALTGIPGEEWIICGVAVDWRSQLLHRPRSGHGSSCSRW
jgi:hypothetical protein